MASFGREVLLPEDERLERVQQVFDAEPCEETMHAPVRLERDVVEAAHLEPRAEVLQSDIRIEERRPRHRERMHSVLVLEDVRRVAAVLAAAARDDAIVAAVVAAMTLEDLQELLLARRPVDPLLDFGEAAGVADAVLVDEEAGHLAIRRVLELHRRRRPLVGHHAAPAIRDVLGQPVLRFELLRHSHSPESEAGAPAPGFGTRRAPRDRSARDGTDRRRHCPA